MNINELIAHRMRELRSAKGWSLDTLAERSKVSRSTISLIERAQSSPTAAVLDRLATAMSVTVASLFERSSGNSAAPSPVSRAADQVEWADPASGYVRRNLSPAVNAPIQLVDVHFPAGKRVTNDSAVRDSEIFQQVWMISGTMELTVGTTRWTLEKGDCLAMKLDSPISFYNPAQMPARYLVALTTPPNSDFRRK
ncbi:MAG: helix-turn-helix domain-containing protein [Janthinobacterium lividum]